MFGDKGTFPARFFTKVGISNTCPKAKCLFLFFENLLKLKLASLSYIIERTAMADLIYPTEGTEKSWTEKSVIIQYREKVL